MTPKLGQYTLTADDALGVIKQTVAVHKQVSSARTAVPCPGRQAAAFTANPGRPAAQGQGLHAICMSARLPAAPPRPNMRDMASSTRCLTVTGVTQEAYLPASKARQLAPPCMRNTIRVAHLSMALDAHHAPALAHQLAHHRRQVAAACTSPMLCQPLLNPKTLYPTAHPSPP